MAYTFEELNQLPDEQLEQLIGRLQVVDYDLADRLPTRSPVEILADSALADRLAHTPLANRLIDTPFANSLVDTPLPDRLENNPRANRLANTPLANRLARGTLPYRLTNTPLANSLADSPLANDVASDLLSDSSLVHLLAENHLVDRLADSPLVDRLAESHLVDRLAQRLAESPLPDYYETISELTPRQQGLVVALLTAAVTAAWVEVVAVAEMMEMSGLDERPPADPPQADNAASVRDAVIGTLALPQDLTEDQAADLSRDLEPLRGRVQQLLDDDAFDKLGPGVSEEVERTLDSLFDRELAPRDGRSIKSQMVLGLVHRLADYANQVDPDPQVSSTLVSFETAIDEPGGNSDAAKQTAEELVEEADWDSAEAKFEEYVNAEFLGGRDPDVVAIELNKLWTAKYVTFAEMLGWRAKQAKPILSGAASGVTVALLFGNGITGLIFGAITACLGLFVVKDE